MRSKARGSATTPATVRRATAILIAALAFTAGITIGSLSSGGSSETTAAGQPGSPEQPDLAHIQSARQLAESQPGNADAWIHLGNACYDAALYDQAITAYTRGLSLAPDNADAHTDLGTAYRLIGQFDEAVAQYNEALLRQPRHNNARLNKGIVLYYDLGRKQEALEVWNALLLINPDARGPNAMSLKEFLSRLAG